MISNARQLDGVLQIVVSEHITRANVEAGVIDFGDLLACSNVLSRKGENKKQPICSSANFKNKYWT